MIAENLSQSASSEDVAVLDGNALVGRNAALVIGLSADEAYAAVAQFQTDGSLSEDGIGSLIYLAKGLEIADGSGITLTTDTISSSDVSKAVSANTLTLNDGTALVIAEDAFGEDYQSAAVTFKNGSGSVVGKGGEIILDGDFYIDQSLTIASGASVSGSISVSTLNGLLTSTLSTSGSVTMGLAEDARSILHGASNPLYAAMVQSLNIDYADDSGLGLDYLRAASKGSGEDADTAARLAVFGGAVQATLLAQQSTIDAISGRLGMANPNAGMILADNRNGGGLWLMPVYRSQDSDDFSAQGIDYGADIDLYGVALGADFTTASGWRVGAMFNIGSGDADGKGASSVDNDFDYWGVSIYGGKAFGDFALTADVGYTKVSNDLDASSGQTGFGRLSADTDVTALTVGVQGEYRFDVGAVDLTPHIGVRFTDLDMDSYTIHSAKGAIGSTDADSHQIVSIPFGVTIGKSIEAGDWTVRPVFDLTFTANTGDTDFDSDTRFSGLNGKVSTSAEIADDFTYGGTLGIQAKYAESLSFGVNVSYVGSENTDEFGVMGDIRYMF